MQVHTHECRDCGEGFDCSAVETSAGCPDFDGLCDECARAELVAMHEENEAENAEAVAHRIAWGS